MAINLKNIIAPAAGYQTNRFFRINMEELKRLLENPDTGTAFLDADNTFTGNNTFTGSTAIEGTTTNDSASAGYVGEYLENKSSSNTNYPTSNTYGDAGSLSLTAGDWDLTLQVQSIRNSATWTRADAGISSTSGNSATGLNSGDNLLTEEWASSSTTPQGVTTAISEFRVSLASPTTYYAKVKAVYSAGQPQYTYRFSARRRR